MRRWTWLVPMALLTACAIETCTPSFEPIPVEPIGLMIAARDDGVRVECRGLEPQRCRELGAADLERAEGADRVIVSCVGRCTPEGGEFRIDVVRGRTPALVGNGGYGEFVQSCQ